MKLEEVRIETIDPKKAEQILTAYPYARQRTVNPHYVKFYADMMRGGEWLPGTEIAIAHAPNGDGKTHGHLVNGQHRLKAVIDAGASVEFTIKHFACQDDTEIAKLYGMTDTGRARNLNDYLRALSLEHEFGFSPSDNTKLGAAVGMILANFQRPQRTSITPQARVEAIHKYAPAASIYLELLADIGGRSAPVKMRTAAVMSVALVTLDEATSVYGDDKVEKFWFGTGKNDGLHIGDPRKVAHAHLFESSFRGGAKRTSPQYTARYLANCFNAWVEGREIRYTRVNDAGAPININGTSF